MAFCKYITKQDIKKFIPFPIAIYLEFAIFQKHENFGVKQIDKCLLEIVEFRFSTDTATKRFNFQKRFQYHSHFCHTIIYRFSQT